MTKDIPLFKTGVKIGVHDSGQMEKSGVKWVLNRAKLCNLWQII